MDSSGWCGAWRTRSRPGIPTLERTLRLNLKEWSRGFHPCETALQHPARVYAGVFSPDGKTVLTGCDDGTARMWDATTGNLRNPLLKHKRNVAAVAFSPDGKQILTGDDRRDGATLERLHWSVNLV